MQTVSAWLTNNPKILELAFLAMVYWGEDSNSKLFYKYKFLSKDFYWTWRLNFNPLSRITPYFIIVLFLTPDDFTRQGESACVDGLNAHVFS
jgi:hypothetical protein